MTRFNYENTQTNSLTLNMLVVSVTYEMKTPVTTVLFSLLILWIYFLQKETVRVL